MARITVTDCLEHVDNRFELVLVAAKRTRQLLFGATPMVDAGQDKPTVIALREIAEGHVTAAILEEEITVPGLQFDSDAEEFEMDSAEVEAALKQHVQSGRLANEEEDGEDEDDETRAEETANANAGADADADTPPDTP